jgi:hypothetical protein
MKGWVIAVLALSACSPPATNEEMWAGRWTEPTPDVMRALAAKDIRGCGEFYQKANTSSNGDYAVACSRMPDGSGRAAWVGYEVFVHSGEVLGPDLTAVYTQFGGPPRELTKEDL